MKGIEQQLDCPPELCEGNPNDMTEQERQANGISKLPVTEEEVREILQTSEFIAETVGPVMVKHLLNFPLRK
eukprot:NODE_2203_length_497_cov_722.667411_g1799_i0.p2 GENE.NODE_2203_length_497_cov_722.667411_g1799_i0~~NODE_2203_length_497_cov_722.667411_g1799_i0.p2  ORF type:complete len:72 (+),score=4.83 NODE_2203_length_497_cov_722.667411_g1799_i0:56-271(+)